MRKRKLYNFADKNLDRQIVDLLDGLNNPTVSDPVTGKTYTLSVDSSSGVPQLVLVEQ